MVIVCYCLAYPENPIIRAHMGRAPQTRPRCKTAAPVRGFRYEMLLVWVWVLVTINPKTVLGLLAVLQCHNMLYEGISDREIRRLGLAVGCGSECEPVTAHAKSCRQNFCRPRRNSPTPEDCW